MWEQEASKIKPQKLRLKDESAKEIFWNNWRPGSEKDENCTTTKKYAKGLEVAGEKSTKIYKPTEPKPTDEKPTETHR